MVALYQQKTICFPMEKGMWILNYGYNVSYTRESYQQVIQYILLVIGYHT